jgi:hypothetical protein
MRQKVILGNDRTLPVVARNLGTCGRCIEPSTKAPGMNPLRSLGSQVLTFGILGPNQGILCELICKFYNQYNAMPNLGTGIDPERG